MRTGLVSLGAGPHGGRVTVAAGNKIPEFPGGDRGLGRPQSAVICLPL